MMRASTLPNPTTEHTAALQAGVPLEEILAAAPPNPPQSAAAPPTHPQPAVAPNAATSSFAAQRGASDQVAQLKLKALELKRGGDVGGALKLMKEVRSPGQRIVFVAR